MLLIFFFHLYANHPDLHSFPTRRSSDLDERVTSDNNAIHRNSSTWLHENDVANGDFLRLNILPGFVSDRKSTRLNSSHTVISYAVFCLKKKKHNKKPTKECY